MSPAKHTIALAVLLGALAVPAGAQAGFGFVPGQTTARALNSNGTVDEQASSHPGSFVVHFEMNTESSGEAEGGEMRDALVDAPAGLVGNPSALPICTRQELEEGCPTDTQVGVLHATVPGAGVVTVPIFNLTPPPGVPALWGATPIGQLVLQYVSLRTEDGYVLRVSSVDTPLKITAVTEAIWGVPADPVNDPERTCGGVNLAAHRRRRARPI